MNNELMLKVENVYKKYRLGTIGGGTLTADLQSWWAKVRHKEDPNSKIGSKAYERNEEFYALKGISFEVKKGEALGLIGGNGAGKSTTLKLLSQVTAPTEGKIYLNGRIASMLEVGTGFHPELTGRENIYMNGAILGMTKAEIDAKIEDIIEFSECRQFIDTPVKRYSSGMYVKLAFSVAAHLDSEIMIMDEVLAVGDMAFQKKCINKMVSLSKDEGRTILYVSHNMNTIRQLCNRCIVLNRGKVIFDGETEQAITYYSNQVQDFRDYYDFSSVKRSVNESRKLQLIGLKLNDQKNCRYSSGDSINFTLNCLANADCINIGLRFELFSMDGNIVGTTFFDKEISADANDNISLDCNFDLKNIAPGKYYVVALAFETGAMGIQAGIDRVEPALMFEIDNQKSNTLQWLSKYWGHIHFDNVKINGVDKK